MHLWIDNTGLHAAGRCFDGKAKAETDLDGLLQLASQIVFAEHVELSKFESDGVRQRSAEIRDICVGRGLDESPINLCDVERGDYATSCQNAGAALGEDIEWLSKERRMAESALLDSAVPDISPAEHERINALHVLITSEVSPEQKSDLLNSALEQKAVGAPEYTLVAADGLLPAVKAHCTGDKWSVKDTQQLAVYMRYKLNSELAELRQGVYAPAVPRARIVNTKSEIVLEQLDKLLGATAERLGPRLLDVPSISDALVRRSRGFPLGLIEEAVAIREKSKELRQYLGQVLRRDQARDHDDEIRDAIRELGAVMEQDLQLSERPRFRDLFQLEFLGGLVPFPDFKEVAKWAEFQWKRKRVTVLSEFAKCAASQRVDPFVFKRLRKHCGL